MHHTVSSSPSTGLAANLGALTAAVLFGLSAVAVHVAVQEMSPSSVAVYRYGQGALVLILALLVGARTLLQVKRKDSCLAEIQPTE